jgi:rubrerythrin
VAAELTLDRRVRLARVRRKLASALQRPLEQRIVGHHLLDEPGVERLGRVDEAPAEHEAARQLVRQLRPGHVDRRDRVRGPDPHLSQPELGLRHGEAQVATQGEDQTTRDGVPVDRGDDGAREAVPERDQPVGSVHHVALFLDGQRREREQVETTREEAVLAGDDDGVGLGVAQLGRHAEARRQQVGVERVGRRLGQLHDGDPGLVVTVMSGMDAPRACRTTVRDSARGVAPLRGRRTLPTNAPGPAAPSRRGAVMAEKPSYLGLLNAVACAESRAHEYLSAWAEVTRDDDVRKVLRIVATREGEHGLAFAKRIHELGFDVRETDDPKHEERVQIARSDRSDLDKLEALGVLQFCAPEGEPDIFDSFFRDHSIDIQTGGLLGRYVAEERDTLRLLQGCKAELEAKPAATGSTHERLTTIEDRVETVLRAVEDLANLVSRALRFGRDTFLAPRPPTNGGAERGARSERTS